MTGRRSNASVDATWQMSSVWTLPIRTRNPLNTREHWAARARRTKTERELVGMLWLRTPFRAWRFPLVVTLTRVAPRKMDDDGAVASLKAIRDEVAKQLGVNDGGDNVFWHYAQERGPYAVRIEIREAK